MFGMNDRLCNPVNRHRKQVVRHDDIDSIAFWAMARIDFRKLYWAIHRDNQGKCLVADKVFQNAHWDHCSCL